MCAHSKSPPRPSAAPQDDNYRLWGGAADGSSCAFKAADGTPLYYPGYQRVEWDAAPSCAGSLDDEGVSPRADSQGRKWGWENDAPCAYKATPGVPACMQWYRGAGMLGLRLP